jgi:NADPH:quinone reductase-like Zn-dependent oxidoreductase
LIAATVTNADAALRWLGPQPHAQRIRRPEALVQNAANSGVGCAVIAIGKERGIQTINLVRRDDVIPEVVAAGGDVVLKDDDDAVSRIAGTVGDKPISLALDSVGGTATARLAKTLSQHGHLVGYAFMGGYDAPGDFRPLMDKDITLHSFYQVRPEYDAKIPRILDQATALITSGKLNVPVAATYPLSAIKDAVAHVERGGKVLLDAQET